MQTHILSEREKAMLQRFTESGETTDETFRMLKKRLKSAYPRLVEDYEILIKAIDRWNADGAKRAT
jgi:hypothetical protein